MSNENANKSSLTEQFRASLTRYQWLKRFFILLGSFVSLAPLFVMTAFYYHLDQTALKAEIGYSVTQILSNAKRTLEFSIEERLAAMNLVINQESFASINNDEGLAFVLSNLKSSFGGFLDLGLIDSKGNQNHYIGPYALKGQNYSDQSWFHEVSLRGIFISEVFMGHRNFPHFIIAVKKEQKSGDYYVLRASIDLVMLDRHLRPSEYTKNFDVFLINQQGLLQTGSKEYGDVFNQYPLEIPHYTGGGEVINEYDQDGKIFVIGHSYIEKSPFILIVKNDRSNPIKNWISTQTELVWFLSISCVLILIAIILSSTYMINRMQEADSARTKVLHNIEYTNKMATIGRMAAGVAHEINNPLAIINEKAGLVQDIVSFDENFPKREKILKAIESILNSVERGSRVTHRLLGFGKRLDSSHELIDLEMLINEVIGFISTEAEHRNINLNVASAKNVGHIESNRGQLQQVFLNLINNAFAAVPDGGEVSVIVDSPTKSSVTIAIEDNGHGISKENIKNIFEPFYSTKGEFGTGLGLSITYEIIEKLGGDIKVESELEKGTCFIITLPQKF